MLNAEMTVNGEIRFKDHMTATSRWIKSLKAIHATGDLHVEFVLSDPVSQESTRFLPVKAQARSLLHRRSRPGKGEVGRLLSRNRRHDRNLGSITVLVI